MREILLSDVDRQPNDWSPFLGPSDTVALFSHVKLGITVTPQGYPISPGIKPTCMIFDSVDEAEIYCQQACGKYPLLRCDIYDYRGRTVAPLRTIAHPGQSLERVNPRIRIRRMRIAATGLLVLSVPLFYWDYRHGFSLILPALLGINCFLISLRLFHWAQMELDGIRIREASHDR